MPEVRFKVRWPDGTDRVCYSPSTVIRDFIAAGTELAVEDFLAKARAGLRAASGRVEARYGSPCQIALAEIAEIERAAVRYPPRANVTILSIG